MSDLQPRTVYASDRECDVPCAHCGLELQRGDKTSICRSCGSLHHESCWERSGGCASYECSGGRRTASTGTGNAMKISANDLAAAVPLPVARDPWADDHSPQSLQPTKKPWNRTAAWAFFVALLGIPLFGLVTGLAAITLGCIALVLHTYNRRGMALAVLAILIGIADVLGWAVGLYYFSGNHGQVIVSLDDFMIDPESLEQLPEPIGRAMRANVLIQSQSGIGLLGTGLGSGVILKTDGDTALIVTNRHVIDPGYATSSVTQTKAEEIGSTVFVTALGQPETPSQVVWVAPHGVDLALISARISSTEIRSAHWQKELRSKIGDPVFAVGNPHGLGWTHTAGDISQLRRQSRGTFEYRVIQTTAAINSGNSGGGLYDAAGMLLGINTWTQDKRFAEGLGFSIAFATLLDLIPDRFELANKHAEQEAP
ncbi:MAG: trypsin-like peptidase domain-containing protein [Planctomycetales bacterium]|nr:trypsin-like peptidase domain-containing protein [Planctomycetales bacterium]